jgi:ArsR family transcriptional regulator
MKAATKKTSIDTVFRAFSDRTRLRIMNLLRDHKEICVCDIMRILKLPQAKVSRHLAYLRAAELVNTRRDGQWIYYKLCKPESAFHTKMLECLRCCLAEVPELQADRDKLKSKQSTKSGRDCC